MCGDSCGADRVGGGGVKVEKVFIYISFNRSETLTGASTSQRHWGLWAGRIQLPAAKSVTCGGLHNVKIIFCTKGGIRDVPQLVYLLHHVVLTVIRNEKWQESLRGPSIS